MEEFYEADAASVSSLGTGSISNGSLSNESAHSSVAYSRTQQAPQPLAPRGDLLDDDDSVRSRIRTIRFRPDGDIASFHDGADMEELSMHRREIWYQYEELKNIKRKALLISKEAQRYGLGTVLTNTYGKSCEETQGALNTWCRNGNSRRGLERWINDEYAAKRSDIRKRTIQSVIRAQAKMKDSDLGDPDYSSKVLSRLSEAFSVDSKQFARGMGVADEIAASLPSVDDAGNENEDDKDSGHGGDPRKTPSRKKSPHSVMSLRSSPGKRLGIGRNLGITAPSVSSDFRHYY